MIEYNIVQLNLQAAILTMQTAMQQDEYLLTIEALDDKESKSARQRVRKMKRYVADLTEMLESIEREVEKEDEDAKGQAE